MNDLKFALRPLLKNPGFTAVAVLTLALGIGANTAIFSVIHAVLIRPFPYPDQEQIVFITGASRKDPEATTSVNPLDLEDWRTQTTAFSALGGSQDANFVVTGVDEPARVKGANLSPSVLELLRVPPVMGRMLSPADNQPGAARVCVLTDRAWERFFGRRGDVLGKTITLDGNLHEVVGVMPANFKFWDAWVYVPLIHGIPPDVRNLRGVQLGIWAIGRLKPGISAEHAEKELDIVARRIEAAHPTENKDLTASVRLLAETVGAGIRPTLFLLFGAVGCVLLIACVNVTNLLLARGAARERELAVRAALGATRWRLIRQLLGEALPIGLLAAVTGSILAWWGLKMLLSIIPKELIPAEASVGLSFPVLLFTATISLLTAVVAGLIPAWQASQTKTNESLKSGGRGASSDRGTRIRAALVVTEVALAFALLIGAGLLIRNLVQVAGIDPGFRVENVLIATVQLPEPRYIDTSRSLAIIRDLSERIGTFPGVIRYGAMGSVPMGGPNMNFPLMVQGRTYTKQDELRSATYNAVTKGAMEALGLRLKEGRFFNDADRAGGEPVVIINSRVAKEYFGTESPIGKMVASGFQKSLLGDLPATGIIALLLDPPYARVVGVVEGARQFALTFDSQPEIYVPYEQSLNAPIVRNNFSFVLHTSGDTTALAAALRRELMAIDPQLPLDSVRTMATAVKETLRGQQFIVVLLGVFASLALLLAVIGIYSVMSWMVSQRTRELGIRLALGAAPTGVIHMVVRQGSWPVLIGLVCGVGLALGLSRAIASQLVNIKTTDPLTYLLVGSGLLGVAVVACWIPARRAARVDPMIALRSE
jgi:predicted permease